MTEMEALMATFFLPPAETDAEYEITLSKVAAEMADEFHS